MENIGVDIGGTKIKIGVVDNETVLEKIIIDTPVGNVEELINAIANVIDEYKARYDIKHIGLGIAGQCHNGKWSSDNIKYEDVDFKEMLEKHYPDQLVNSTNDANTAAIAELLYGNLKDVQNGIFMTFGTGIGGGIIINGRLYEGSNGNAGEIGHQIIMQDGIKCSCGARGCYEAYASTKALINRAKELVKDANIHTNLKEECNKVVDNIDGKMIFKSYNSGDEEVVKLVDSHIKYMSMGIINILHILDIDTIIIGGGISKESEVIIPRLKEYIKEYKTLDKKEKEYTILVSKFCNEAGLIGAANLYKF